MRHEQDFLNLLEDVGIDVTPNRLTILSTIGSVRAPLSAQEIMDRIPAQRLMNRVTVYRILDLFVEKRLLERISTGDRSFRYGINPLAARPPHPHFFCTQCRRMKCLDDQTLSVDLHALRESFPGAVEKIEIRLDGICPDCLGRKELP